MQRSKAIVLTLLLLGATHWKVLAQVDTTARSDAYNFGDMVFRSLRDKNANEFAKFFASDQDCERIFQNTSIADSAKALNTAKLKQQSRALRLYSQDVFKRAIDQCEIRNIVWSECIITEVRIEEKDGKGAQQARIILFCEYAHEPFYIVLNQCIKEKIWFLFSEVSVEFTLNRG